MRGHVRLHHRQKRRNPPKRVPKVKVRLDMGRVRPIIDLRGSSPSGVATGELDVRLSLHRKAGCRPNQATSAAAVGMQPIARPLMEILGGLH